MPLFDARPTLAATFQRLRNRADSVPATAIMAVSRMPSTGVAATAHRAILATLVAATAQSEVRP